jgi:beta-lactamase class A
VRGNGYMERKDIAILVVVMMAFFATLYISKQQVVASGSIPAVSYISTDNKDSIEVVAEDISEAEHEKLVYDHLLEYKQSKIKENFEKQVHIDSLEKEIRAFVGNNIDKFGLVYYDVNSGKSIEINSDKQFVAASTIKVPINMLAYDMVKDKKIDINEKLEYQECDYEDGAGVLQGSKLNNPIALKTLSDFSIIYSDNIAINMLLRKVGNENRYNYIEKIVGHTTVHEGNNTSPRDSFKILERLYSNPEKNKYYSTIIETMKKTEYHDRIDKYIPREIVAHKIGDFGEYVNDMGIVYKKNPYILVVFTKEIPEANEVIGQVSKIIYDAQK